ncbi:portal protein [Alteromonas phage vB_AcoS-R7M]|uniref:Portal protein n=1 Tax=Alteromonas phage vB_AcoS-R7M TaxID=2729541 RepID=A0A6M3YNC4_9CAUD|nr:portal protein [Alteromonas phage vB_AcoS-R7M]QJI53345.1 portal protein [Alteromonas phage vB_AcoS-R7M]
MSITSLHPKYSLHLKAQQSCKHAYEGEEKIKDQTTDYLPATSGQKIDGQGNAGTEGDQQYGAYLMRAVFPEIMQEAVEAAIGRMHSKPPTITLPSALEPLRDNASLLGESLEDVLRNINFEQLVTGRVGIMGDIRKTADGSARPLILLYEAETIRNWDDTSELDEDIDINFVVLDESDYVRSADLGWEWKNFYRVLGYVSEGAEGQTGFRFDLNGKIYGTAVLESEQLVDSGEFFTPVYSGKPLEQIPFVFANASDMSPDPSRPPLMGLVNICLAIYRAEADYNQSLFMQGQDTLVRIGAVDTEETVRTGAGAKIDVPINGDAKYIGVSSQGLPEQRQALENRYARALQRAGSFIDSTKARESGEALRLRQAGQSATLPQIAKTGAAALERILKMLAIWVGANPDEVEVKPNLEFAKEAFDTASFLQLMQAKGLGAPISKETIHKYVAAQGLTDKTFEEETTIMESEVPGSDVLGQGGSVGNEANGIEDNTDENDNDDNEQA